MAATDKNTFLPTGVGPFLRRRAIESGGVALIALAVALFAALATYHPSDPSLNTASGDAPLNLLSQTGAIVSDLLLQSLGLSTLLATVVMAAWGWRFLTAYGLHTFWLRLALLPIGVLSCALTLTALGFVWTELVWPIEAGLGGFVGRLTFAGTADLIVGIGLWPDPRWIAAVSGVLTLTLTAYLLAFTWAEWRALARRTSSLTVIVWRAATRRHYAGRGFEQAATAIARRVGDIRRHVEPSFGKTPAQPSKSTVATLSAATRSAAIQSAAAKAVLVEPKQAKEKPGKRSIAARQRTLDLGTTVEEYQLPPLDLLDELPADERQDTEINEDGLQLNARLLEQVLDDFGVQGEIVKVRPGPVVTLYELVPAPGTKTSRVIGLSDDIARSMSAISVRIAVIPGRNVIGIELPNNNRETVYLRELLDSQAYEKSSAKLPLVLGKDIGGAPVIADLERMPHLLVAGTTGSGKSVGLNTMVLSLLFRMLPEECKFIMIDPKMLELAVYDDIPHLITPVVTEPRKAIVALKWTVREMERRYRAMSKLGVRHIEGYNKRVAQARAKGEILVRKVQTGFDSETGRPVFENEPLEAERLPYIVVVVDEMADLMSVAGKDIESAIQRLSQMARAAGIHIVMATQRPSVDVVTGTIKANFPTRIGFQVTSRIDSRTILGEQGAEQLLGQGDMLYMAGGGRITRVHGPFVKDEEVESVVRFLKTQGDPIYIEAITEEEESDDLPLAESSGDALYDRAVALVAQERKASTSFIQRHLQIGYNRAARIIEQMEKDGLISEANHVGKREVLAPGLGERFA
jgi:S-DNA-T family DNA segregation ATPase FtsK/SpoIIIE